MQYRTLALSSFIACCLLLGCFGLSVGSKGSTSSIAASDWKVVWQDEFNEPTGSPIDNSKWTAEVGGKGWGNNELQYYTTRLDNAFHSEGSLAIKVIKERYTGADHRTREYTSARLIT